MTKKIKLKHSEVKKIKRMKKLKRTTLPAITHKIKCAGCKCTDVKPCKDNDGRPCRWILLHLRGHVGVCSSCVHIPGIVEKYCEAVMRGLK